MTWTMTWKRNSKYPFDKMFRFASRRPIIVASLAAPATGWALVTTINDEWDSVVPQQLRSWKEVMANGSTPVVDPPRREKLLILGTGWAALECLRKARQGNFDVTVVSPRPFFLYTPLLAGATVGTVHHGNIIEPIRDVLGGKDDAAFVQATALSVDPVRRTVLCELPDDFDAEVGSKAAKGQGSSASSTTNVAEFEYGKLVIAVGARPATFGIPGVEQHAFFLKELDHSAVLQQRLLGCLEKASALQTIGGAASAEAVEKLLHFVVVGGGPTGVELAAELNDFVRSDVSRLFPGIAPKVRITLLEAAPRILGPFQEALANHATAHLESQGVCVRCCTGVTAVLGPHRATVKSTAKSSGGGGGTVKEEAIDFGALVWAAGIATRPLVCDLATSLGPDAGQNMPRRGLAVDKSLRVKGLADGNVFALGDCALSGLPPTAQVAAQQGKWLGRLLRDNDGTLNLPMEPVALPASPSQPPPDTPPETTADPEFEYKDQGKMAYIGSHQAIVSAKPSLGEPPFQRLRDHVWWRSLHGADTSANGSAEAPVEEKSKAKFEPKERTLTGGAAFAFWRGVYFSKLLSGSNRLAVATDWVRAELFGRDVTVHQAQMKRYVTRTKGPIK